VRRPSVAAMKASIHWTPVPMRRQLKPAHAHAPLMHKHTQLQCAHRAGGWLAGRARSGRREGSRKGCGAVKRQKQGRSHKQSHIMAVNAVHHTHKTHTRRMRARGSHGEGYNERHNERVGPRKQRCHFARAPGAHLPMHRYCCTQCISLSCAHLRCKAKPFRASTWAGALGEGGGGQSVSNAPTAPPLLPPSLYPVLPNLGHTQKKQRG
jgi:hypothetical protein